MPGAIADVGCKDVATESTESLGMNDIEAAPQLQRCWQSESKNRGECIGSPCGNGMEVYAGCPTIVDLVGKNMHLMLLCESAS